jgi:diaminopimelate decarboxylase
VSVEGVRRAEIAERFGTPTCVLDEEHVRVRCRQYVKAMAQHEVAYAAGAFWCRAMARWIAREGLSLDACSEGELVVARAAGFTAGRILLHGSAKTARELSAALDYGVGRVVIDSPSEVAQLAALAARRQKVSRRG